MAGGLMQLVAFGAQDAFLTGQPDISFFKVAHRRHTNFAIESIEQTFNGTVQLGNRLTAPISRNGDLITNVWLEASFSNVGNVVNSLGHAMIEYVELEIGGQQIDKHYGEWLEIWSELTLPEEKRAGFKEMIGRRDAGTAASGAASLESNKLYIPLQFFFCRNPGLALPLIALQYHEVRIIVKLRTAADLVSKESTHTGANAADVPVLDSLRMYVDYVYLDQVERTLFAKNSHEYLIEQLQHTGPESTNDNNHRLNFNHPVKELVWVVRRNGADPVEFGANVTANWLDYEQTAFNADFPYAVAANESFTSGKLQLNGHDRFSERDAAYFRLVQPYQHHSRIPHKYVYCYSFALNPEAHQPSGSCNFSRLDTVTLVLNGLKTQTGNGAGELLVYAVNLNVLRIRSGMGGLAFSN
jgi:hypothetical protein